MGTAGDKFNCISVPRGWVPREGGAGVGVKVEQVCAQYTIEPAGEMPDGRRHLCRFVVVLVGGEGVLQYGEQPVGGY